MNQEKIIIALSYFVAYVIGLIAGVILFVFGVLK
jgi:hypothetical protein